MKIERLFVFGGLAFPLLVLGHTAFAQIALPPLVTIQATDPVARRSGDPGEFRVYRDGATNMALNLFCWIYGTATNGVDYERLSNWVTIPAGELSAPIKVVPIDNGQTVDLETVVVQLDYPPMMPPINYTIGDPRKAVVYITGKDATNLPPVVRITTPPSGWMFREGANILMTAEALGLNPNGYVATVEFFENGTSLGITINNPLSGSPLNPFMLTWSNVPAGEYKLTAKATDNQNLSSVSEAEAITVSPDLPLPVTVDIVTSQPNAAEPCDNAAAEEGRFTVTRSGGTNVDLPVFLTIRGSASNGVDYATISNVVVIPKGSLSADISVVPLADMLAEGPESVALQVATPACVAIYPPPPDCYIPGLHPQAVLWIQDCQLPGTNFPPLVRIIGPANGSVFRAPVDIPLFAYARDFNDAVSTVEFFAGTNSLGLSQVVTSATRPMLVYSNIYWLVWSNAPLGTWQISAKATDVDGASRVSLPVKIVVSPLLPPPPGTPPIVSIFATDPIAIEGTNCWPWLGVTNAVPSWSNWTPTICKVFTNCGPKNALFSVRRFGSTNAALTVGYQIGGTASNGVDYAELPGTVTIAAGERRALVPIVPLDGATPHTNKTVVLRLSPSTDYQIGFPARAAALIIDSQSPNWFTGMLPGGAFRLNAQGPDAAWFHIEYSTDLKNWTPISTNQVVNGSIDFIDPDAIADQSRFYRAVPEPVPPMD